MGETVLAVTSLSPDIRKAVRQKTCIQSWVKAGMRVASFNHTSEIPALAPHYAIEFVPLENTTMRVFEGHYIPIHSMLHWAAEQQLPTLLINSDIELCLSSADLKRVQRLSENGLCYFVRHNFEPGSGRLWREPFGIDGFLLHGRDGWLFEPSFLSMGQPFWDYWIPFTFATAGRSIFSVEFPAALHQCHPQQWHWENWHRCALEFDRVTGILGSDKSFQACHTMSWRVRERFERKKTIITPHPFEIRAWVQEKFGKAGSKTFLELGAHDGTDTAWMAALPDVTIYAFEPDPRNNPPPRHNVVFHRLAIGDHDGISPFILSKSAWGREWTYSSSIKAPKNHLSRYPVTFGERIEVGTITLDSFCRKQGLGNIDFIWADIQGAEGDMIRGGRETLSRTKFLYTEYSDDFLYESQVSLREIIDLLPNFRIIEIWPDEVLLENMKFKA